MVFHFANNFTNKFSFELSCIRNFRLWKMNSRSSTILNYRREEKNHEVETWNTFLNSMRPTNFHRIYNGSFNWSLRIIRFSFLILFLCENFFILPFSGSLMVASCCEVNIKNRGVVPGHFSPVFYSKNQLWNQSKSNQN